MNWNPVKWSPRTRDILNRAAGWGSWVLLCSGIMFGVWVKDLQDQRKAKLDEKEFELERQETWVVFARDDFLEQQAWAIGVYGNFLKLERWTVAGQSELRYQKVVLEDFRKHLEKWQGNLALRDIKISEKEHSLQQEDKWRVLLGPIVQQ